MREHSLGHLEDKSCSECSALAASYLWELVSGFGWKVGLLGLFLVIVASNVGLTLHGYLRKRFTLSSYRGTRGAAPPFETHGEREGHSLVALQAYSRTVTVPPVTSVLIRARNC